MSQSLDNTGFKTGTYKKPIVPNVPKPNITAFSPAVIDDTAYSLEEPEGNSPFFCYP